MVYTPGEPAICKINWEKDSLDLIATNIGSENPPRKINPELMKIGWNNDMCLLFVTSNQTKIFGVQDSYYSYDESSFSFSSDFNSSYMSSYEDQSIPENSTQSTKLCSDPFNKKQHNFEVTFFATSFIVPVIVLTFCYISIYQEVVSIQKGLTAIKNKTSGNRNNQ